MRKHSEQCYRPQGAGPGVAEPGEVGPFHTQLESLFLDGLGLRILGLVLRLCTALWVLEKGCCSPNSPQKRCTWHPSLHLLLAPHPLLLSSLGHPLLYSLFTIPSPLRLAPAHLPSGDLSRDLGCHLFPEVSSLLLEVFQAEWCFAKSATEGAWDPLPGTVLTPEQTLLPATASDLLLAQSPPLTVLPGRFLLVLPGHSPSETPGRLSAQLGPGQEGQGAANVLQLFPAGCSGPGSPKSWCFCKKPCHRQGEHGWHLKPEPSAPHP